MPVFLMGSITALDFAERLRHESIYAMHRDLVPLRRSDALVANDRGGFLAETAAGIPALRYRIHGAFDAIAPRDP